MPITYINGETKIPALVIGYLDSRRTDLALPNSTTLPFVAALRDGDEAFTLPCLVIEATTADMAGNDIELYQVTVTLKNKTRGEKSQNVDVTDLETESTWVAKIRAALSNKTEFMTWITTQPAEDLPDYKVTGWCVKGFSTDTDSDSRIRKRITECRCVFRSYETTTN